MRTFHKILSFGAVFLVLVALLVTMACQFPESTPASELDPINPDPTDDPDSGDDPTNIGYSVYINFKNEIRMFQTTDPTDYQVIATDIHPTINQFEVSDNGVYVAYTKNVRPSGESGNYLVFREIGSSEETYVYTNFEYQDLTREFFITGNNDLVVSNTGVLQKYDLVNGGDLTDLNGDPDENHVCNHFPAIFANGTMMTFIDQIPNTSEGSVYVIPYSGVEENPIGSRDLVDYPFGTYVYPTLLQDNKLVYLNSPYGTDTLRLSNSPYSSSSVVRITCSETAEVNFNKIYQSPGGSRNFMYGFENLYWFENDGSIAAGDKEVSGRTFTDTITNIVSTPDDRYTILTTKHGVWLYNEDLTQLLCEIEWLNQADEVLWVEIK